MTITEPNQTPQLDLKAMLPHELPEIMAEASEPAFKAKVLFQALHKTAVLAINDITTLKKATKEFLEARYNVPTLTLEKVKVSTDQTRKYQFKTHDGHLIESVFIPHAAKVGRHSLCISSQVGCAMGCTFCATSKITLKRNLLASEIVSQVYQVEADVRKNADSDALMLVHNQRAIHNIVYMGMGEPLHNFHAVLRSIELLTHPDGWGISPRRITVSTSGLVPRITELGEKTGVYLAVSLNATTDEVRGRIMPVNNKWRIDQLLAACKDFPLKVRERITFEYVMLKGVNDTAEDAHRLVKLMDGLKCKVNLIPFNEHPLSPFKRPDRKTVLMFHDILYRAHISVFTRKTRGDDIDAACGMLGAKKLEDERLLQKAA
jgi:23S rRNA (adenine2503-C2)-methyltransferase